MPANEGPCPVYTGQTTGSIYIKISQGCSIYPYRPISLNKYKLSAQPVPYATVYMSSTKWISHRSRSSSIIYYYLRVYI